VAELVVHQRMRLVVGTFVKRGLVPDEARGRFDAAIAAAMRLRNSVLAEVLLIAIVYGLGVLFIWRRHAAMDLPTWYGTTETGKLQPTLAGWWLGCVSLPSSSSFSALVFPAADLDAVSLAGVANRPTPRGYSSRPRRRPRLSFHRHLRLRSLTRGPGSAARRRDGEQDLLRRREADRLQVGTPRDGDNDAFLRARAAAVFTPRLARTKRIGLAEYGGLAQRYVREFDQKWLRGGATGRRTAGGQRGHQSLADLGNSFEIVKGMKPVPFGKDTLLQLAVISLAPVAPLV
jgi:hypothetical protein